MTEAQKEPKTQPDEEPQQPPSDAERIARLETHLAEVKDQALRALAEAENTRRRAAKEREEVSRYAVANFAKEILTVSDNLTRALEALPKDSQDAAIKNVVTGVEATDRQMVAVMERFGVKRMNLIGQAFDPNFHQVMQEIDDPSQPAGTIVQVFQTGYLIHDRLLREAMVVVTKGGPARPKADTSA